MLRPPPSSPHQKSILLESGWLVPWAGGDAHAHGAGDDVFAGPQHQRALGASETQGRQAPPYVNLTRCAADAYGQPPPFARRKGRSCGGNEHSHADQGSRRAVWPLPDSR